MPPKTACPILSQSALRLICSNLQQAHINGRPAVYWIHGSRFRVIEHLIPPHKGVMEKPLLIKRGWAFSIALLAFPASFFFRNAGTNAKTYPPAVK